MIICPCCGKPKKPAGFEGFGTALKPAIELIALARKPLSEPTIAKNIARWGTGAINVGGCKIPSGDITEGRARHGGGLNGNIYGGRHGLPDSHGELSPARWPANLIHDGSDEVLACFPEDAGGGYGKRGGQRDSEYGFGGTMQEVGLGDSGSAARFFASFPQDDVQRIFYTSKAGSDDRLGSKHPTVKPLDLIQYLVRLITPKNGVCLDLFAGSGTTGEACFREGFKSILIERESEYIKDIERRMSLVMDGPDTRAYASAKARNRPRDDGPLFGHEEKIREPNLKPSASPRRPYADDTAIWGNNKATTPTFGGETLEQVAAKIAKLGEELGLPEDTKITLIPDETAE